MDKKGTSEAHLDALLKDVAVESISGRIAGVTLSGIAYDSRQVRPGGLFVALNGGRCSGADFIEDALRRGALAVVSEVDWPGRKDAVLIKVRDARVALAALACAYYGHPSRGLQMTGITGTNGKTTTAFMVRDVLAVAGRVPGLIGTVQHEFGARVIPAVRTTPESADLQALLAQMVRAGCHSAVMEVSSHGLVQHRTNRIDFDVAVFTNLTRDHLDYHGGMEAYFSAKQLLFSTLGNGNKKAAAALNVDDPFGRRLAALPMNARCLPFGFSQEAAVRAENIRCSRDGSWFRLVTPWGVQEMKLRLLGRHNVSNALGAVAACGALGVDLPVIVTALERVSAVPGRLQTVDNQKGFRVFVDYAHTDDALQNVLSTLREITPGRLLVMFGCGGHRDRTKRPKMGAVAARLADFTVITSDNPRDEAPEAIVAEIVTGFGSVSNYKIVIDRRAAIAETLAMARAGDTVLLAGKGHEKVQEFEHTVVPFDDYAVAREFLG